MGIGIGEILLFGVLILVIAGVVQLFRSRGAGPNLATQLASLEELRKAGSLSEEEFSKAKEKAIAGVGAGQPPSKPSAARRLFGLAALLGLAWFLSRLFLGGDVTQRLVATAVHAPIDLVSAVENVPASSWRALPFTLPYSGRLSVNVEVKRGNKMGIRVLPSDQIEAYKAEKEFRRLPAFDATDAQFLRTSENLPEGTYYLVLRDDTLGILSASSSDVAVGVRLEP
jgi:hypothetical protein